MEYPNYLMHFNPNHDPKTGQFAPGTGSGESAVNKIGTRLKKADLLDENYKEYKTESGPAYKRMKAAADTGLKALLKLGDTDVKLDSPEHWDYWFLFEDATYGQAQVADLANKGKSKEQIKQIIKDSVDFIHNTDEYPEIPGVYSLYLFNEDADYMAFGDADSFIDACVEAAKENKQVKHSGIAKFGNYLCHYNKNHSPKNGQFVSGDGDGDSVRDDHHNYSKNKVTSPDGKTTYKKMTDEAITNTVKGAHREFTKKHEKEADEAKNAAISWMENSSRENNLKYIEKVKPFLEGLGEHTAKALLNEFGEMAVIDFYNKYSKESKVKDSTSFIEKHKENTVDQYWGPEDIEYMVDAWKYDWN